MIRVWTKVESRRPVPLLAKIIDQKGPVFIIKYLTECDDKIWRYEEDVYEIEEESIENDFCTTKNMISDSGEHWMGS